MYHFERATVWRVLKVDIKAYAAALAVAEPLTSATKLSVPLIDLNANSVDALTTNLATEFTHKRRRAEATSSAKSEIVLSSESETDT